MALLKVSFSSLTFRTLLSRFNWHTSLMEDTGQVQDSRNRKHRDAAVQPPQNGSGTSAVSAGNLAVIKQMCLLSWTFPRLWKNGGIAAAQPPRVSGGLRTGQLLTSARTCTGSIFTPGPIVLEMEIARR